MQKEGENLNAASESCWETWSLGLVAGVQKSLSSVGLLLIVLWLVVLIVMASSLSSLSPRSPPICTRTTTTCGLSRSRIQTQVMWWGTDASCVIAYSQSSTFLTPPEKGIKIGFLEHSLTTCLLSQLSFQQLFIEHLLVQSAIVRLGD